ncbi:hypothetical protein QTH25_13235 [Clostridium perfringens]|uniref:hypothetical protein n=1 Tax=Clostridium perfringens TaxID=1502 RepID=UPI00338E298C|nr:hypothetical protein [Clostridium perfringens]
MEKRVKLLETIIMEFKYDSEEERTLHVETMEDLGWICDGQIRRSDDSLGMKNREWYWFARFQKIVK